MPLLTEQAEGGSVDSQKPKSPKRKESDLENGGIIKKRKKPHFSSDHSEYDIDDDEKEGGSKRGEYIETSKCCYCIPLKIALILFSILVIVDFAFECWDTYELLDNSIFDTYYGDAYAALLGIYFFAVVLVIIYWCLPDSPSGRAILPWPFLIASIINFLFAVWLCVYILGLYPKEWVYINRYTQSSNLDESEKQLAYKYKRVSKVEYVLTHLISPVLDGTCFIFVYCTALGWVKRHENQE